MEIKAVRTNLALARIEVFRDLVVYLAEEPMSEADFLDGYYGAKEENICLKAFAQLKELGAIKVGADGFLHFPGEQKTDLGIPEKSAYRFQETETTAEVTEQELKEFEELFELGYSQTKIIKAIWRASPDETRDYKKALRKYRQLLSRM